MPTPTKPTSVIKMEGKSHRTKEELKQREAAEAALATGLPLKVRSEVKNNKSAFKEFKRDGGIVEYIKTVLLSGDETIVTFPEAYPYFWVQNLSNYDIHISVSPNIQAFADGVYHLPSGVGNAECVETSTDMMTDTLYIRGNGKVQIIATHIPYCPFG